MPTTNQIKVKELKLDLKNFRTIPQKNEHGAVNALISISADRFWALMESLIDDGFIPTENIIVIKGATDATQIFVKEGNRRVACLKLIHGDLNVENFNPPDYIISKLSVLPSNWKEENLEVPCVVYENDESKTVDKIINLTHGKGDKASRDKWPSIATARHNRDMNKLPEPGLDLLEKYFKHGKNITKEQKENWSGNYPITILDETLPKIASRIDEGSSTEIPLKYPNIKYRDAIEKIMSNIGLENISFKMIRNSDEDVLEKYGIPTKQVTSAAASTSVQTNTGTINNSLNDSNTASYSANSANADTNPATQDSDTTNSASGQLGNTASRGSNTSNSRAYAINDPKGLTKTLKSFNPSGLNRQKVVTLKNEAINLNLKKNPIAFCFLLRSMFEISVKAYFGDSGLSTTKNGKEKTLKDLLNEAKNHLTNNGQNTTLNKELHGAITELNKSASILSVTSMNQLVHNSTFSVTESDICTLFVQIFPLLKALN
jgi:hypothetical protein